MRDNLLEVQDVLRQGGIMICFSGRLSQGLIEEYGEAVKKYLETEDRPTNMIFKIFSIFIEQTQNIKNYCMSKENSDVAEQIAQSSIVTIGKQDQNYFICSGNMVENYDVEKLKSTIDPLIHIDKDGLKQLYKEKLKQDIPIGSNGAGIGLIDIARKASQPLNYSITPVDERLSFFKLKVMI